MQSAQKKPITDTISDRDGVRFNALQDALWLPDLVALFSSAVMEEGMIGHICFQTNDEGLRLCFGDMPTLASDSPPHAENVLTFRIGYENDQIYCLAIAQRTDIADRYRDARLHALATVYVHQGIALAEAGETTMRETLSQREFHTLNALGNGQSYLDVAEELGLNVHTISIYVKRALAKLGAQSVSEAIAMAANLPDNNG